jgi:hypothetical protein
VLIWLTNGKFPFSFIRQSRISLHAWGRRSYISAQLRVARTWVPLFFWLLCTALINTFLIARQHEGGRRDTLFQCNRKFQRELAWQLVLEGYAESHPSCQQRSPGSASLGTAVVRQDLGSAKKHQNYTMQRTETGTVAQGSPPQGNSHESRRAGKPPLLPCNAPLANVHT